MRPQQCRKISTWLLLAVGSLLIITAIGAGLFGADADAKWGPFRKGILLLGMFFIAFHLGVIAVDWIDSRILVRRADRQPDLSSQQHTDLEVEQFHTIQPGDELVTQKTPLLDVQSTKSRILIIGLIIFIEILYVWFISVGHMTKWHTETEYYGFLAEAFANGQVALLEDPDPALANLENPYPTSERSGTKTISDASYYEGKYYIYWGAVPALIIAPWTLITSQVVGDQYIVFIAVSCIFLFSTLILLYFRRHHFPSLPFWLLMLGIIVVGTAHPMLWVLNWPAVYPAAIASGQAFLMAGIFFGLPLLSDGENKSWRLILVGTLFALAFGSRTSIVPALVFLTITLCLRVFTKELSNDSRRDAIKKTGFLFTPLILGFVLWGSYNLIRFDDFFQTGFKYQMSVNDLPRMLEEGLVFNPIYLIPNLFYYFVSPVNLRSQFPIIRPLWGEIPEVSMFLARFGIPEIYRIEDIVGIVIALPSIILVGYLMWEQICYMRIVAPSKDGSFWLSESPTQDQGFRRIVWILFGAGVLAAAPILLYFWVANRFLLDAVPIFAILASLGAWLLYLATRTQPLKGILAKLFIVTTVLLGAVLGFLLAVSGADSRFDDLNPELFNTLSNLFSITQ